MLIAIIKINVNTNPRLFDSVVQCSVGSGSSGQDTYNIFTRKDSQGLRNIGVSDLWKPIRDPRTRAVSSSILFRGETALVELLTV